MRTSFYDFCVKQGHRALLAQWDEVRNAPLTTGNVSFGSHQKVWWQCSKGHSWQAKVYSRSAGSGCPYCTGRKEVPENSLAVQVPSLEAEWDAEKNALLKFADLTIGSHKKVWGGGALRDIPTIRSSRAVCAGHRLPCLRGACCSAGRKLPRGKVSRTCCRMGYREERSSIADAGRPGNGEKGLVALSQGTQLPCRHLIPRGWWNRLPILRRAKGHTGRKRPRYPIPAACRAMGRCEKTAL